MTPVSVAVAYLLYGIVNLNSIVNSVILIVRHLELMKVRHDGVEDLLLAEHLGGARAQAGARHHVALGPQARDQQRADQPAMRSTFCASTYYSSQFVAHGSRIVFASQKRAFVQSSNHGTLFSATL